MKGMPAFGTRTTLKKLIRRTSPGNRGSLSALTP